MLDECRMDSLCDRTGCFETWTLGPYGATKLARTLAGAVGSNSVAVVEIVASSAFFSSSILLADGGDIGSIEEWWRCIKKCTELSLILV